MTNIVAAQLLEAEQASNEGMHHAATMWDLSNFYEAMDRNTLQDRHKSTGFPSHLSTITRSMYGCRRLIRSGDIIVDGGCPTRGIPAGCAAATYHVQAYLSEDAAHWAQSNPGLGLNIHIDDLTMYATAKTPEAVARKMAQGLLEMKEMLEERWGCELAWPKVATVTSNEATRKAMEERLTTLIGPRKKTATNLGFESTAGRARARTTQKKTSTQKRWTTCWLRKSRVKRLARQNKEAAEGVFRAGLVPSMTFGSQLWGADDAQIEQWQRLYKATTGGRQGKSKTLYLLLAKDPTAKAATGPVRTLAEMLWEAAIGGQATQYSRVRQAWVLMQTWDTKTPWKQLRGPAAAAAASLHRIGWKAGQFPTLIDEENRHHNVLGIGPKALGSLLDQAWHRRLRKQAAAKQGLPNGQEIDLHHARQIIKAGGLQEVQDDDLLQPDEGRADGHKAQCRCPRCVDPVKLQEAKQRQRRLTATARNFVTGGIWDKPRLRAGGYDVPDAEMKCDLCESPDSLEHRLWHCPATKDLRQRMLTEEELVWLRDDDECGQLESIRKQLAKKGLCRHPGIGQPTPAKEGWVVAGNTAELLLSHRVAIDGHCSKEFHPALNRASWSVVGWDPDEATDLHVAGPVWDGMPHTRTHSQCYRR